MRTALVVLSAAVTACAAWPYLRDVRRGITRPRLASWLIWAAATGLGAAGAAAARQYPAAMYAGVLCAQCLAITVTGWAHRHDPGAEDEDPGRAAFDGLDLACVIIAAGGLAALAVARDPVAAALAACATDGIATIPTIRNAWRGQERTWSAFALFAAGAVILLTVADWHAPAGVIYPAFIVVLDGGLAVLIAARTTHLVTARDLWMVCATVTVIASVLAGVRIAQILLGVPGTPAADAALPPQRPSPVPEPDPVPPVQSSHSRPRPSSRPSPLLAATPSLVSPAGASSPVPPQGTTPPPVTSPEPYPSPSTTTAPSPSASPTATPTPTVTPSPTPSATYPSPSPDPAPSTTYSTTPTPSYSGAG